MNGDPNRDRVNISSTSPIIILGTIMMSALVTAYILHLISRWAFALGFPYSIFTGGGVEQRLIEAGVFSVEFLPAYLLSRKHPGPAYLVLAGLSLAPALLFIYLEGRANAGVVPPLESLGLLLYFAFGGVVGFVLSKVGLAKLEGL